MKACYFSIKQETKNNYSIKNNVVSCCGICIIRFYKKNTNTKNKGRSKIKMCQGLRKLQDKSPEDLLKLDSSRALCVNLQNICENIEGLKVMPIIKNNKYIKKYRLLFNILRGAVVSDNEKDKFTIFYSSEKDLYFQRYIIAHELGHCCLHTEKLIEYRHLEYPYWFTHLTSAEKEAHKFARELLIPREPLVNILNQLPKEMESEYIARNLHQLYKVPKKIMKQRINELR